jgi:hypothetical protein
MYYAELVFYLFCSILKGLLNSGAWKSEDFDVINFHDFKDFSLLMTLIIDFDCSKIEWKIFGKFSIHSNQIFP